MSATTQQTIVAIAACCQFAAFIVALIFAIRQARSHIALRRLQSTLAILRYVEDRNLSRSRWFAYEHHHEIDAELDKAYDSEFERLEAIDAVVRRLSRGELSIHDYLYPIVALNITGYMHKKGLIEKDVVPELLASTFSRAWDAHRRFIEYRRIKRFLPPHKDALPSNYGRYLEIVAREQDENRAAKSC